MKVNNNIIIYTINIWENVPKKFNEIKISEYKKNSLKEKTLKTVA